MKKLIITADDYGMSKAVNRAIDAGIEAGIITSTNVMTNMDYYQEAVKLREMNVSVGIHWNITTGKPVLDTADIPTLVDSNGVFYDPPVFRERYKKGLISNDEIRKELIAQYKRFTDLLGDADYWNTHQNSHVYFKIYKLFVDLSVELGINKMRSHQRIYIKSSGDGNKRSIKWRLIEPIKSSMLNVWQNNAHKKGIASPEGMIVSLNGTDSNKLDYVFKNIIWGEHEVGEFVIHPATENDSIYFGSITDERILEYKLFSDKNTLRLIEEAGLQLDTFSCI